MYIPEVLQERRFSEWNKIVKGMMFAWELASLMGLEHSVDRYMKSDTDGTFVKRLSSVGEDCGTLVNTLPLKAKDLPMEVRSKIQHILCAD